MRALVLGACAAAVLNALPAQAAPQTDSCFLTRDIRNHTVAGDRTLYLNVLGRDVYRVEMGNPCLGGAMSSDPLVIRSSNPSSPVCRPLDLDLGLRIPGGPRHCIVKTITRLTADEARALPAKIRP